MVAHKASNLAEMHVVNTIYVVCAPPHAARCIRDVERAVKDAGLTVEVKMAFYEGTFTYGDWFDPGSTQPHVRSAFRWWQREMILRLLPWKVYLRVAS